VSLRLPSPRSTTFSTLTTAQAICHNQHLRHNWTEHHFVNTRPTSISSSRSSASWRNGVHRTNMTHRMNSTPSAMPTRSTQVPEGGTVLTLYCLSCLHRPPRTASADGG
jgi:hypothetical protein